MKKESKLEEKMEKKAFSPVKSLKIKIKFQKAKGKALKKMKE